jgi:DNA invertase Pin-like site-specific DNA recombinase
MKRVTTSRSKKSSQPVAEPKAFSSAVIYCRVSRREQGISGLGLEAQEEYCRRTCQGMGLQVAAVITEVGTGTKNPLNRVPFMQAVALANANGALLMVAKLDRLSRDYIRTAQLLEGELLPVTPTIVIAESPNAKMLELRFRAIIAAEERELISARTKAALAAKAAREPEFVNGRTGKDDYLKRVDDTVQAAMRKAAYYRRSGNTWAQTAARLNEAGFRTSRGTLWTGNYLCKQFAANPESHCTRKGKQKKQTSAAA